MSGTIHYPYHIFYQNVNFINILHNIYGQTTSELLVKDKETNFKKFRRRN